MVRHCRTGLEEERLFSFRDPGFLVTHHSHHILADQLADRSGREHPQISIPERTPDQHPADASRGYTLVDHVEVSAPHAFFQ